MAWLAVFYLQPFFYIPFQKDTVKNIYDCSSQGVIFQEIWMFNAGYI